MAEVSESLQYRFEESGLDDLRRDMKKLSGDVEELGDEFSELGGEAEAGSEAAEEAVEDLQRRVSRIDFDELGDEAMEAADEVALAASLMEEELEGVQEQLDDISTIGARRQMRRLGQEVENVMLRAQALDAQDVDIDADVDRDRAGGFGGGRGGVRLPGELDEVQEGAFAFGAIPPQIQALAGAATAAAAALGAGAGLAGVATMLAAELGPQGLQSEVKAVQSTFKETGREFASAFSDVIRSEVLPAARGLASVIRGTDDALAAFSGTMIDLLKNIPGGLSTVGGTIMGLQAAGRASQGQSNADALAQGIGDVSGIRGTLTTMNRSISRVRERFEQDLIPREEMLSQIKSFRMEAFKSLQKLKQQIPGAFPPALLDNFAAKLRKVKRRLKEVQQVSLEGVAEQPADASEVSAAGRESLSTPSISENVPDRISAPSGGGAGTQSMRKQARAAQAAMFRVRQQLRLGVRSMSMFGQIGTRALTRLGSRFGSVIAKIVTFQSSISSVGGAFRQLGNAAVQVLQKVIAQLASAAAMAAILGPILGVSGGGFGSIFKGVLGGGGIPGMASGGIVTAPTLAMVGEGRESEAVMPLSKLEAMIQPAQPSAQPAAMGGAGGVSAGQLDTGAASINGDTIEIPVDVINDGNRIGKRNKGRAGRA
jgi:hypothetical protein